MDLGNENLQRIGNNGRENCSNSKVPSFNIIRNQENATLYTENGKRYKCALIFCDYKTTFECNLKGYIETVHAEVKHMECIKCNNKTTS